MAATLKFGEALQLIPSFSGGNKELLTAFENKCEFLMGHVDDTIKPLILKAILVQLNDKANEAVRYRHITSWEELKTHLRFVFGNTHSVQFLQKQLNEIRHYDRESVQEYASRVEETYIELTAALTSGKPAMEATLIAQAIHSQALDIFISRIHFSIRIIFKTNKITTFEEAVCMALEKEKINEKSDYRNNTNYNNRNRNSNRDNNVKENIKCYRCSRFGHYSNECRTSKHKINFNSSRNSNENRDKNTESQKRFCHYCKKNNHVISECRRRMFNENNKNTPEKSSNNNTDESRSIDINENNACTVIYMERKYILCTSENFKPTTIKLSIVTGSKISLIKISALKGHVMVNEKEKHKVTDIIGQTIETIGTVNTCINIEGKDFLIKFSVVSTNVRVPGSGIIGCDFIKDNHIILDFSRYTFTPLCVPEKRDSLVQRIGYLITSAA